MSLLNDALRKKRSERYATREASNSGWSKAGCMSNRKRQWIVALSGIVLLAAASTAWLWLYASPVTPNRTGVGATGNLATVYADNPKDLQVPGSPSTASQAASPSPAVPSMSMPAPVAPVAPAAYASGVQPAARKHESVPAPQPSAPERDPSRMQENTPRTATETGPEIEGHPVPALRNPVPQALAAGTADGERLRENDRLFQRACQFHRRNALDQAIALYQAVLKEEPEHAQARFNLVAAYLQTGAYTQAYRLAAKLFSENPTNQQVMLNLAIAHIGCGRDREALALLDKAAKLPEAPLFEIAFHKALALGHIGQQKSALACYQRAETIRPDDPGLLFNMAVAYDQQQQYGAAVDYYSKYLEHVRKKDAVQINQIRRRIRALQAYGAEEKLKE